MSQEMLTLKHMYLSFQSADAVYQQYYQQTYGTKAGGYAMGPQYMTANIVSQHRINMKIPESDVRCPLCSKFLTLNLLKLSQFGVVRYSQVSSH